MSPWWLACCALASSSSAWRVWGCRGGGEHALSVGRPGWRHAAPQRHTHCGVLCGDHPQPCAPGCACSARLCTRGWGGQPPVPLPAPPVPVPGQRLCGTAATGAGTPSSRAAAAAQRFRGGRAGMSARWLAAAHASSTCTPSPPHERLLEPSKHSRLPTSSSCSAMWRSASSFCSFFWRFSCGWVRRRARGGGRGRKGTRVWVGREVARAAGRARQHPMPCVAALGRAHLHDALLLGKQDASVLLCA